MTGENRKAMIGIAFAVAVLGGIAYWNWGPRDLRWLPRSPSLHNPTTSLESWRFVEEWTAENGYAPVEGVTYVGYGPDAWRWEVELEDGEDLVFHWHGETLCSVFLDKPVEPVFDDPSPDCDGLRAPTDSDSPR